VAASTLVERTRDRLGPVGVWLGGPAFATARAEEWRRAVRRIEQLGYGSLWGPEGIGGKDAFAQVGVQLAASDRLTIGTGIANIWARHPATMQAGAATLAEAYPGRFVLGVGVSLPALVEASGQEYGRPLARMRDYLDRMDAAADAMPPPETFARVLAALGPRMLEVARDRADGVHSFSAPVEHTATARQVLGPDRLLIPEQAILVETNPDQARAAVRNYRGAVRLDSPYTRNCVRFGYGDDDFADGGSDRLIDALTAWGKPADIAARIQDQFDAGADHVLVHPLGPNLDAALTQLEQLAPALAH
jgi:probable F420-dependent oxidoreductase